MKPILRTLSVLLAALTICLCFAACDGKGSASALTFKTADGAEISIGAASDPIIEKLGNGVSAPLESASCGGFEGKDYVYTYQGFRISTTPDKDGQIVCKVELTDDSVKSPEGLCIGMSRADVEAAMKGFTAETVGDNLAYTVGGTKLQVSFRDGAVVGIVYVAA